MDRRNKNFCELYDASICDWSWVICTKRIINMSGTTTWTYGRVNYDKKKSLYISSPFLVGPQTDKCASKQKTSPLIKFFRRNIIFVPHWLWLMKDKKKEQGSRVSQAGRPLNCWCSASDTVMIGDVAHKRLRLHTLHARLDAVMTFHTKEL
jgi:hypothetical protein